MEYEELKRTLKELDISMKKFSSLANISYGTVKNWGNNSRVPSWVIPFLQLYTENQECKKYKESMQVLISGLTK